MNNLSTPHFTSDPFVYHVAVLAHSSKCVPLGKPENLISREPCFFQVEALT